MASQAARSLRPAGTGRRQETNTGKRVGGRDGGREPEDKCRKERIGCVRVGVGDAGVKQRIVDKRGREEEKKQMSKKCDMSL